MVLIVKIQLELVESYALYVLCADGESSGELNSHTALLN